ncbi:hypothetical protein [Chromobacterium alticapitis]|uniref:Uncharacterized protein n=1 Tax=Chromobacterium alticapitis TaxID=2073169 RepID=A0A2S5DKB0_9NEIS|nr:hypothetical protein [Chromobacterium alticapitis]POZ63408.1 hypothetical protein C2I19_03395 [Chromobacterium alticapitis]
MTLKIEIPVWKDPDGNVVACVEKLKVMRENLEEIAQMAQDAFEDAVLMGCDEQQVRDFMVAMMRGLENPYRSERED